MTPQRIADQIVSTFDVAATLTVEQAVIRLLHSQGMTEAEAIDNAPANVVNAVTRCLQAYEADRSKMLPFQFSENNPNKLVGKARRRAADNTATLDVRSSLHLENELLTQVYRLGDCGFERLTAQLLVLAGASDANAGCAKDDGGIDVWGRVPILNYRSTVASDLLPVSIVDTPLLLLAQCKCYNPNGQHSPEEIRAFSSAVDSCKNKYRNNSAPPSRRVPSGYYEQDEIVVPLLFSTASFSEKAIALARSLNIFLVDGAKIAQYLLLHQVGIDRRTATLQVDSIALQQWANLAKDQAANLL